MHSFKDNVIVAMENSVEGHIILGAFYLFTCLSQYLKFFTKLCTKSLHAGKLNFETFIVL